MIKKNKKANHLVSHFCSQQKHLKKKATKRRMRMVMCFHILTGHWKKQRISTQQIPLSQSKHIHGFDADDHVRSISSSQIRNLYELSKRFT